MICPLLPSVYESHSVEWTFTSLLCNVCNMLCTDCDFYASSVVLVRCPEKRCMCFRF